MQRGARRTVPIGAIAGRDPFDVLGVRLTDWYASQAPHLTLDGANIDAFLDRSGNDNDCAASNTEEPQYATDGDGYTYADFDGALTILARLSTGYTGMTDAHRPVVCAVVSRLAEPASPIDTIVFAHKGTHPVIGGGNNSGIANLTCDISNETRRCWRGSFRYAASSDKQDVRFYAGDVGDREWIAMRTTAAGYLELWRNGVVIGRRKVADPLNGGDIDRVDIGTSSVDAGAGDINHRFFEGCSGINPTDADMAALWSYFRAAYALTAEPSHGNFWDALGGGQAKWDWTMSADSVTESSNVVSGVETELPVVGELLQSTAANRPTYVATGGPSSTPMVAFDGGASAGEEEHLTKSANLSTIIAGEYTYIAMVVRIASDPGNNFNMFALRDGVTTQTSILWLTGSGLRAAFRDTTSQKTVLDSGFTLNAWSIVECWADEATAKLRMFVDGGEIGSGSDIVSGMNASPDTILFGDSFSGQPAEMDVATVRVATDVTAAQRAQIVADMESEYGL